MSDQASLANYTLHQRVTLGGTAELYLASDVTGHFPNIPLLVKRLLPHLQHDEDALKRFTDEAKLARQLNHPNIPQFVDYQVQDSVPSIVLVYIPGFDLRQLSQARSQPEHAPTPQQVAYVGAEIAKALSYVHELDDQSGIQLLHRDVTPDNIILGLDGSVSLIDFGLARNSTSTVEMTLNLEGKLGFEAPETRTTQLVDERTDLYTLGLSLYQFWTATPPAPHNQYLDSLRQFSTQDAAAQGLSQVLLRCLAPNPDDRFRTANELQTTLQSIAGAYHSAFGQEWLSTHYGALVRDEENMLANVYSTSPSPEVEKTQALGMVDDPAEVIQTIQPNPGIEVSLIGRHAPHDMEPPPVVTAAFEPVTNVSQPTLIEDVSRELTGSFVQPVLNLPWVHLRSLLLPVFLVFLAALMGALVSKALFARAMDRRTGQIMLEARPNDQLSVSLDGQLRKSKTTPMLLTDIRPGQHQLIIRRPGFVTVERNLTVEPNALTDIQIPLERKTAKEGSVTFQLDIPSCNLSFGDRILAISNGQTVKLPADKPLHLTVTANSMNAERRVTLQLKDGEQVSLRFTFDPD